MIDAPPPNRWWGPHEVAIGRALSTRLGPLTLWIAREPHEWRLAFDLERQPLDPTFSAPAPCEPAQIPDDAEVHRVAASGLGDAVVLVPRLADKPVVARPADPFTLLPRSDVSVYVSTPLTVAVETLDEVLLHEVPVFRPKRTWLGANTRTGELCYASTTSAQLQLERLSQRPGRAVTTLRLRNDSDEVLALDRVSLPVTQLSLFADAVGRLWTERVQVRLFDGDRPLEVSLDDAPPADAAAEERVAEPRVPPQPHLLRRVFAALFD